MTRGLVYYSDGLLQRDIAQACRDQLQRAAPGLPLVSVSLTGQGLRPTEWRAPVATSASLQAERGALTMFRQILTGLLLLDTDAAFLCEHDVLYHPCHFEAEPPEGVYLYNQNVWKVRAEDGHALHYPCSQTSGLCASRLLLIAHYRRRLDLVLERGFSRAMGFEPGTHGRPERVDDFRAETYLSAYPNVDIRHSTNLTESRWRREQFRNQRYTEGWTEGDGVPGWGRTRGRFAEFVADLSASEVKDRHGETGSICGAR